MAAHAPRTLARTSENARASSHEARRLLTAELLQRAQEESDPQARVLLLDQVVEANLRIAFAIARRYFGRGVPLEDLEQTASEALVKAVRRFDPRRQHDLLDYAIPTIRGEVQRYFRDRGWAVRPPRRIQELQQRMRRTADDLANDLGREPSEVEVAQALNVATSEHREALAARGCFQPASLDRPAEPGSELTLGELMPTTNTAELEAAEARTMLEPLLSRLDDRSKQVIHLRYIEQRSQVEIGQELGVTQPTVSRWLRAALAHLRSQLGPVTA